MGADAAVVATERPEFKSISIEELRFMRGRVVADPNRFLNPEVSRAKTLVYAAVGRRGVVVSPRGRGILVTGASQGFGRAVAEACVDAGANLFLCARSVAELEETCRALRARAAQHQVVGAEVADVSDPDAPSQLIGAATRQLLPGL